MWWIVFWTVCCLMFWAVAWGIVAWSIKRINAPTGGAGQDSNSAIDIASERLARGEISRKEFEELRETLQGKRVAF